MHVYGFILKVAMLLLSVLLWVKVVELDQQGFVVEMVLLGLLVFLV